MDNPLSQISRHNEVCDLKVCDQKTIKTEPQNKKGASVT